MTLLGPAAWRPVHQSCEASRLYDEKTPGLFKTEWCGDRMVALNSKTYYCQAASGKDKLSCKGIQKNANAERLTFETYLNVLNTSRPSTGTTNRGIVGGPRGRVYTYEQERTGLTYGYFKRRVLADGIHTEPLSL